MLNTIRLLGQELDGREAPGRILAAPVEIVAHGVSESSTATPATPRVAVNCEKASPGTLVDLLPKVRAPPLRVLEHRASWTCWRRSASDGAMHRPRRLAQTDDTAGAQVVYEAAGKLLARSEPRLGCAGGARAAPRARRGRETLGDPAGAPSCLTPLPADADLRRSSEALRETFEPWDAGEKGGERSAAPLRPRAASSAPHGSCSKLWLCASP